MQDLKEMGDRFELRMGNREVAMLIGGLFVMLVVAFSLGVMMGKKLYVGAANTQPVQTAAVSTPATPSTSQEPTASQPPPQPKTPSTPAHTTTEEQYSFPDTLKNLPATSPGTHTPSTSPAATKPEPTPAATPASPKTPATPSVPKTPTPSTSPATSTPSTHPPAHATVPKTPTKTEPVTEPEPNPKKKPTASPSAAAAPSGAGPWTIQVAAVADKKRADDYVKQLKAKGLEAWVSPLPGTDKTYYRVRIGHFPTSEAATEERDKLKTAGTIPQDSFVRK